MTNEVQHCPVPDRASPNITNMMMCRRLIYFLSGLLIPFGKTNAILPFQVAS
jgi:hypothetical protein